MRNRKINDLIKQRLSRIPSISIVHDIIDDIYTHYTTFIYYCKYKGSTRGLKKFLEPLDEYMEEVTKEHVKFKINKEVTCDELEAMGVITREDYDKNEKVCDEYMSIKFIFRNDVLEKIENDELEIELEKRILKFREYKKILS